MVVHAQDDGQAEVPRLQRRRIRAGIVQGPHPARARAAQASRRHLDRRLGDPGADHIYLLPRGIRVSRRTTRARDRRSLRQGVPRQARHGLALFPRGRLDAGRRSVHRRRGDGAARVSRGEDGEAPQEATLPCGARRLRHADDGQQRGNVLSRPAHHRQRSGVVQRLRHREKPRHHHFWRVRSRRPAGSLRAAARHSP